MRSTALPMTVTPDARLADGRWGLARSASTRGDGDRGAPPRVTSEVPPFARAGAGPGAEAVSGVAAARSPALMRAMSSPIVVSPGARANGLGARMGGETPGLVRVDGLAVSALRAAAASDALVNAEISSGVRGLAVQLERTAAELERKHRLLTASADEVAAARAEAARSAARVVDFEARLAAADAGAGAADARGAVAAAELAEKGSAISKVGWRGVAGGRGWGGESSTRACVRMQLEQDTAHLRGQIARLDGDLAEARSEAAAAGARASEQATRVRARQRVCAWRAVRRRRWGEGS